MTVSRETWPMVRLGDVCDRKIGKWDLGTRKKYVDISSVDSISKKIIDARYVDPEEAPSRARQVVQEGDVLVSTVRPNLNAVALVSSSLDGHVTSTGFCVLRPDKTILNSTFLFSFVQTNYFIEQCVKTATGISYPATTATKILDIKIPLPPLAEQRRIAEILEVTNQRLNATQKQLEELDAIRNSLIREIDDLTASTCRLEEIAAVSGGLSLSSKRAKNPIEANYLRVANVQRNSIDLGEVKTIRVTEREFDRCLVADGDILMLEANANPREVGRAAIISPGDHRFVFQNHLFRVRSIATSPIVLNALLSAPSVRLQLIRCVKTTSGLNTMTINQARDLLIPDLPTIDQERFESQLLKIEELRGKIRTRIRLLEELHQSLSTRAFAGQL